VIVNKNKKNRKRRVPGALLWGHNLHLAVNPGHLCLSQKKRYIYIYIYIKEACAGGASLGPQPAPSCQPWPFMSLPEKKIYIYIYIYIKEARAGRVPGGPSPGPQLATSCQPWPLMCLRDV